jgi:integral membrane protein (TIGR01906 family)
MLDVKIVLQGMIRAWWILGGLLLLTGIWAWRANWLPRYWKALQHGALGTLGLIAIILVTVATSFNALFTAFHRVFFTGDTWLFNYSDTLIRLFPLKLWSDGFTLVGLLTTLGALILLFTARRLYNR